MEGVTYQPRSVSFLELWRPESWRIKIYGIAYAHPKPDPTLLETAKVLASRVLSPVGEHYGVGFVGVHQGKTEHFIFVDWWARENELNHRVFTSALVSPTKFTDTTASGVMACVWDLAVISHEREAWIETVMKVAKPDDFKAYLERRLEGEV